MAGSPSFPLPDDGSADLDSLLAAGSDLDGRGQGAWSEAVMIANLGRLVAENQHLLQRNRKKRGIAR